MYNFLPKTRSGRARSLALGRGELLTMKRHSMTSAFAKMVQSKGFLCGRTPE